MSWRIDPYSDARLPALAVWWNEAFRGMRNYWPVGPEALRTRIIERRTAVESFDPSGLLLAVDGDRVVGAIHAGIQPESVSRALDPAWEGGTRGWVALLCVLPGWRRRGVGGALWDRARACLAGCREVFVDGQGLGPYYGNSDGPATPFFGTPEGLSLPAEDGVTRAFLERRGHRPQALGRTYEKLLCVGPSEAARARESTPLPAAAPTGDTDAGSGMSPNATLGKGAEPGAVPRVSANATVGKGAEPGAVPGSARPNAAGGAEFALVTGFLPELGRPIAEGGIFRPAHPFVAAIAVGDGVTVGLAAAYEMTELGRGHWGVYQLVVEEAWQGQGLGRMLLARALAEATARGGRSCEALTLPERSPGAARLYEAAGFAAVAEWAVY